MLRRTIKDVEYEIVSEFYDSGESSSIAKTIGENPVNTYRLTVGAKNPLTQISFNKDMDALHAYVTSNDEFLWNDYWEDPVEESE